MNDVASRFPIGCTRRMALACCASGIVFTSSRAASRQSVAKAPDRQWYEAAAAMKRLAESWADEPYGAVLVLDGQLVGEGPSRVVKNQDSSAHAEREAIRDAQRRLGRPTLPGSVLYSTSRPCSLCQAAAAKAGVSRMYFGPMLTEAEMR